MFPKLNNDLNHLFTGFIVVFGILVLLFLIGFLFVFYNWFRLLFCVFIALFCVARLSYAVGRVLNDKPVSVVEDKKEIDLKI